MITFTAYGQPVPKQSFRYANGHGYTSPRVKAWHDTVAWAAANAMTGRPPFTGAVAVTLDFCLERKTKVDCDNLSKNALDAMTAAGVFCDDSQVVDLRVRKQFVAKGAGCVNVTVTPA